MANKCTANCVNCAFTRVSRVSVLALSAVAIQSGLLFNKTIVVGKSFGLKVNRVRCGEDDGTYTCRAVNSFGRCEASCTLTVTRKSLSTTQPFIYVNCNHYICCNQ